MLAVLFLAWVFDSGKMGLYTRSGQHGSTFFLPLSFIEISYAFTLAPFCFNAAHTLSRVYLICERNDSGKQESGLALGAPVEH
jgi:hypothetical protein